ncbi:nucleoside hydrolase [Erysipelothrix aquatica]|uniref:nucleoside hydrolase n=1 Tax=Erysipelothrix aquatica TaxID=2683714 RepID=UPI00135B92AA|nr:nucleoside hydrolase [Erysipelothrix aquatica]
MKKLILDVDTGIDDSISLAYICGQHDVDLLGVTTVYGNVDSEAAARNTKNLLSLLGRDDVGVYQGAEHALHTEGFTQQRGGAVFHGLNGIGDVELTQSDRAIETVSAVDFLLNMAHIHDEKITIVASGPLTNLAQAIKKDPSTMQRYQRIVLMGGAFTVVGNVSPVAEANIFQDPHAAKVVFESGIPITMIGLDVTSRVILSRDDLKQWESKNDVSKVLLQIMDHYFKAHELIYPQWGGAAMHDPLAAVVALHEDVVRTITVPVTVLTEEKQFGRTVLDLANIEDQQAHSVNVALNVDIELFKKYLLSAI